MTDVAIVIGVSGSIAGCYVTIIGVYRWVSNHINQKKLHPNTDDIVYERNCTERGKTNQQAHEFLQKLIEDSETRSTEQHKEVKEEFKEIKQLLQRR
jgi:hypothetical protein